MLERDDARRRHLARRRGHARAGRRGRSSARPGGGCSSWGCARPTCGRRSPQELQAAVGRRDRRCCATGTLLVARDADEARELERQIALSRLARPARPTGCARARRASASRRSRRRCGWRSRRRTTTRSTRGWCCARCAPRASRPACSCASTRRCAHRVRRGRRACHGRTLARATTRLAPASVVPARGERRARAPGAWSGQIAGCRRARVPVRPVRGQLLRLRDPRRPGPAEPRRALRGRLRRAARRRRATCSARPSRSAALTCSRTAGGSTSCCARRTSSCRASAS